MQDGERDSWHVCTASAWTAQKHKTAEHAAGQWNGAPGRGWQTTTAGIHMRSCRSIADRLPQQCVCMARRSPESRGHQATSTLAPQRSMTTVPATPIQVVSKPYGRTHASNMTQAHTTRKWLTTARSVAVTKRRRAPLKEDMSGLYARKKTPSLQ